MAQEMNLQLASAREKMNEMNASVSEASVANRPQLSAQAVYTRLIPEPENPMASMIPLFDAMYGMGFLPEPIIFPDISGNVYTVGVSVTQPIYTGGKIKNAKKISEHSRAAAGWQMKGAEREVRRDVTKAYYQALAANKGVLALDSAIALMQVMLKDLGNAVEVGMRGENELLQAQVQLANQKLARQQAATGAQMAHDYLAMLIGAPVNTSVTLVNDLHDPGQFSVNPLPDLQKRAADASTDLKALKEQLQIIEASMAIIGGPIPKPAIVAQAGFTGQGVGQGRDGRWDNSGTVSAIAQWNIYDFGADSKRRQAKSQKRQLELGMNNLRVGLDMMVKNNVASLEDAFASIETSKKNIEQSKRSYEISYDKFQEGMLLSSELLNAQNMILQAEISYYAALSNFYARQAELDYLVNPDN